MIIQLPLAGEKQKSAHSTSILHVTLWIYKGKLDISAWLNWATFDMIGDLAFGEPFAGQSVITKRSTWRR